MYKKKENDIVSPDLGKLQEVVIDFKTRIYIKVGENPEEAKKRYLMRRGSKIY